MARKTTRGTIVEMLRNEIRSSSNSSRGLDNLPYLQQIISRYNETITDEWDWPYMNLAKSEARVTLSAGQRYYDFPAKLSPEHIERVWYQETADTQWRELDFGIGPREYSEHDSDDDDRSDVISKWDFVTDSDDDFQFEIWPIPASNNGKIWFEGRKKPNALNEDSDRADHDDHLIVLRCAAEVLMAKNKKDADVKAALAGDRFDRLKSRLSSRRKISVGGSRYFQPGRRTRVLVARSEMAD